MANKYETEITDAEVVEVDFNPLDEPVNEKRYSQPNVNVGEIDMTTPIGEPNFTPPPFQKKKPETKEEPKKREPVNPEMKGLPKKDVDMSAKAAAKMILQGYEWIHQLANKGLKVSEKTKVCAALSESLLLGGILSFIFIVISPSRVPIFFWMRYSSKK